jgi:hypothetical protein
MALTVEIIGDADSLRGLERDLRGDIDLRGTRLIRTAAPPEPGEMGFAPEALQFITDNNELLAAMAGAVAGWLGRQRQPSRIRVKLGANEIEIESDRVKDPEAVAADLIRRLQDRNDV